MAKRKHKRRRGGQPGNRNARKHGFYSRVLSTEEKIESRLARAEGIPPSLAVMRNRVIAVLRQNPGNTRVLREAALELTKYYRSRGGLSREDAAATQKAIRMILDADRRKFLENAGTNQDGSDADAETK